MKEKTPFFNEDDILQLISLVPVPGILAKLASKIENINVSDEVQAFNRVITILSTLAVDPETVFEF